MTRFALLTICCTMVPVMGMQTAAAQENGASNGAVDTEITWAGLQNSVQNVNLRLTGLTALIKQITLCNNQRKFYAPTVGGRDSNGCVAPV